MRYRLLASAVTVVTGGALYLVHAVGSDADAQVPPTTSLGPTSSAAPPRSTTTARAPIPQAVASPRITDDAEQPPHGPPHGPPHDPPQDPAESAARLEVALARRFDDDRVDPAWASAAEQAISETFAVPALAGSKIARVTCRAAICRLEVDHADVLAQRHFLVAAGPTPAFRGAGAARELVDPANPTQRKTLVYLLRDGEPFPAAN